MSIFCGSSMFGARLPFPNHKSSHWSSKPVLLYLVTRDRPVKEHWSQAHISQREMAGTLSGLQLYRCVSNTSASYGMEISVKRKERGADTTSVECAEAAQFSNMSEMYKGGEGSIMVEEKEVIGTVQAMDLTDPEPSGPAIQDSMASLNIKHISDRVSPIFSFGVITDVQFADIPNGYSFSGTPRFYRHALEVLNRAVTHWNSIGRVGFAIHFGDLVDGLAKDESNVAFAKVLAEFNSFHGQSVYHMIGNHCLYNLPRVELNRLFNIPPSSDGHSYYDFTPSTGFRFVVLDGYDISVMGWPEEHPNAQIAIRLLDKINPNVEKNSPVGLEGDMARFVKFNGGLGKDQLTWLDDVLLKASVSSEKVIICCHLPLHPGTINSPSALCWNYVDVLETLQKYSCVVACLSGHAHTGGYIQDSNGTHFVVLEAVLECPPGEDAFGVIDVFPDRLSLTGKGRMASREMYFATAPLV